MAYKRARYGIPPEEVARLGTRFFKYHLAVGFGTLDNFLKFCSECGYTTHMHICKRNPDEPHSPENSYFVEIKPKEVRLKPKQPKVAKTQQPKVAKPQPEQMPKQYGNRLCNGCVEKKCERNGRGCIEYQKAWVENWNKNIHWKKKETQTQDSGKRMAFRYEHPDLVREGIIFESSRSM